MAASLRRWIARLTDRRKLNIPVSIDRRAPQAREIKERLDRAHERLLETVKKHTGELPRIAANDIQQVVIFSTFREICSFRLTAGEHRLCRHEKHEAANTGIAPCNEQLCPSLRRA